MQSIMRILQGNWSELTGWSLVLSGLGLAGWTLGTNGRSRRAPALAQPLRIAGGRPARRLDPASEWQILMDIAERGFVCIERLDELQERARAEIAAADEAVRLLLSECSAAHTPAEAAPALPGPSRDPAPQPMTEGTSRPLAA
jgi:hypothetical protein